MFEYGYYNMDCVQGMKEFPDKFFNLAIVDPPYGIGENGIKNATRSKLAQSKVYKSFTGGTYSRRIKNILTNFSELARIRLFLGQTISFHVFPTIVRAGSYGTKTTAILILQTVNWRGLHSKQQYAG